MIIKMNNNMNTNEISNTRTAAERGRPPLPALRRCLPLLLLGCLAGGCADRTYLTKSHGRAYSEAFDRQAVTPKARPKAQPTGSASDATEGLDSQEASAVSRSYRHSLAGKEGGGDANGQPTVIMNSGAAPAAAYLPPPSVPGGQ